MPDPKRPVICELLAVASFIGILTEPFSGPAPTRNTYPDVSSDQHFMPIPWALTGFSPAAPCCTLTVQSWNEVNARTLFGKSSAVRLGLFGRAQ
jgi:hypothetical protein